MTSRSNPDLPQEFTGDVVRISAPAGWAQVNPASIPGIPDPEMAPDDAGRVDLICAERPDSPRFAENCVITVAELPEATSAEDWYRDSTTQLVGSVPGFQLIDITEWEAVGPGLLRSGVYIQDTVSVTALQWTWVSETSRRGLTATFSCATRDCSTAVERFLAMIVTLEEI
ncbi:hypothetical protein [Actinomyces glycerinitolerans]|uniref:Uncharacterized protein n=1 Tax=Actinomyces glycerinitolerans TaxID=1892869 RepID=A0A1M4RWR4_9ACTO|nr:hypothetical protein [Actinomyces glycerinitolerans]SHE24340.1 Hypothetical protein ACGLYG10_0541 [Actinomyces glycerinitolerans]